MASHCRAYPVFGVAQVLELHQHELDTLAKSTWHLRTLRVTIH